MERQTTTSQQLHQRATETLPGGVSHNVRYAEPYPTYIERADGPYIWDVDGNQYVDFWMNHLASVLGHAHPDVVSAVKEQAAQGLHYGAQNRLGLQLAERVSDFVPSAERVRFCASGTEATMYAVRLARADTGRDVVLKPNGGWHGGNTDLSGYLEPPFDQPDTTGLPPGAFEHLEGFPVNDREAVVERLDAHAGNVAAIITEPVPAAGGFGPLDSSFLRWLREECTARGIRLIFDEVVTGFRVSPGSYQARIDVTPDLTTLGKVLGGGLPIGALCGRADLFENARPDRDISPDERVLAGGGTFTANPMTATAGLETLSMLETAPVYEQTEQLGQQVRSELEAIYDKHGINAVVRGVSSLFRTHFNPTRPLENLTDIKEHTDREALREFHRRLGDRGYYFLPGHVGSISYQTTEEHVEGFLASADEVAQTLVDDGLA